MKSLIDYNYMLKKIKFFIFGGFIVLISFPSIVQAQMNQGARIQNEQQQLIDEEFRRQELERALKRPAVEIPTTTPIQEDNELSPTTCVNIKTIEYDGNEALTNKEIDKVLKKYTDKCLNLPQIDTLLQDITNVYISKGYVTSRAFMTMPQKKLKQGILEIKIIEGRVSGVEGIKKSEVFTAFPSIRGKVLNIRDVEQGLDQMNRLSSNQATMDIKPDAEQNHFSKIMIANQPQGRSKFTFFGDNAGSKSTGEARFGLRSMFDNLLGLNDQVNMTYTNSPSKDSDHRGANSFALGLSIPYGYWTLNNNFSWSNYRASFILVNGDRYFSYGNSTTNDLSLERLISRGQKHKFSLSGGLIYKTNSNYSRVLDYKTRNDVSSRDLTILHLDAPATFYTDYGVVYVKPSYHQGIRAFDSLRDKDYNYSQKAQYKAWKLYGYYSNYFGKVNFTSSFDGQYSKDELFGSEAFFIGGEYTVRGFKEDSVQGDSGFTIRNDAKINLGNLFNSENKVLGAFTPGAFIDYGYVKSNNKSIKTEQLAGAGVGLDINYGYFEGRISYAKPIHKPKWMEENEALYLYAGIGIRF